MAEYTQELQQIWDGALRAAIEGNVATKNTAEEGGVAKYSIREIDGRVMPVIDTKNDTREVSVAQSYLKTLINEENPFATILGKSYLYDMLDLAEKKKVISSVSSTAKKRSEIFEPKPSNQTVPQTAPGVNGKKSARDTEADNKTAEAYFDNGTVPDEMGQFRYSLRDAGITDREILSSTLDRAAENEQERKLLEQYRAKATELQKLENQLARRRFFFEKNFILLVQLAAKKRGKAPIGRRG